MTNTKSKSIIGVKVFSYPEKRNFADVDLENYRFKKQIDFYQFPAYLHYQILRRTHPYWLNLFWDFGLGRYKILHLFNTINRGNKPWITTFEYYLPRGAHPYGTVKKENKYIQFVLGRLANPSCKKLIALSNFAKNAQINYLRQAGLYEDVIIPKIEVLHPPQQARLSNIDDKVTNEQLSLVLVGADFFRKGGKLVLMALENLKKEGIIVKLSIVSKMNYGDYASLSTKEDFEWTMNYMGNDENIVHYKSLSNEKVMNLFLSADIALLPSYEETYGYTILEAQAAGCSVVTTNGCAMTEINNDDIGWVINVPRYEDGRTVPRTIENKEKFDNIVLKRLKEIIEYAVEHRDEVRQKGRKSLHRIIEEHNPEDHKIRLNEIYEEALK